MAGPAGPYTQMRQDARRLRWFNNKWLSTPFCNRNLQHQAVDRVARHRRPPPIISPAIHSTAYHPRSSVFIIFYLRKIPFLARLLPCNQQDADEP
jgi:hypothetical protein